MARIRSVHPGLFTDEAFVSLSPLARVLLVGLWTECDDQGIFEWKPITIKMRLLPVDNVDVGAVLAEFPAANLVRKFTHGGREYGAVRNFCKYQRPKKPKCTHPITDELRTYVALTSTSTEPDEVEAPPVPPKAEIAPQMEDEGGRMDEEGRSPIIKNLAEPSGGRKATRPAIDAFFAEFWKVYPKRGDAANPKKPACDKFERAIRGGADPAVIIAAAARYASIESTAGRSNTDKIAQAVTWLNQQRWQDYPELAGGADGPPAPPDPSMPSDSELRARYAARIVEDIKPEDEGILREGGIAHSGDEETVRH